MVKLTTLLMFNIYRGQGYPFEVVVVTVSDPFGGEVTLNWCLKRPLWRTRYFFAFIKFIQKETYAKHNQTVAMFVWIKSPVPFSSHSSSMASSQGYSASQKDETTENLLYICQMIRSHFPLSICQKETQRIKKYIYIHVYNIYIYIYIYIYTVI